MIASRCLLEKYASDDGGGERGVGLECGDGMGRR